MLRVHPDGVIFATVSASRNIALDRCRPGSRSCGAFTRQLQQRGGACAVIGFSQRGGPRAAGDQGAGSHVGHLLRRYRHFRGQRRKVSTSESAAVSHQESGCRVAGRGGGGRQEARSSGQEAGGSRQGGRGGDGWQEALPRRAGGATLHRDICGAPLPVQLSRRTPGAAAGGAARAAAGAPPWRATGGPAPAPAPPPPRSRTPAAARPAAMSSSRLAQRPGRACRRASADC